MVIGHRKILNHLRSCNGDNPVLRNSFIKIYGLKLVSNGSLPIAALCEDSWIEILPM
jgi:hypothetical protein